MNSDSPTRSVGLAKSSQLGNVMKQAPAFCLGAKNPSSRESYYISIVAPHPPIVSNRGFRGVSVGHRPDA